MRTEEFHAESLVQLLKRQKIATMPELKQALGTSVDVTVFRKLSVLSYRTSYSHGGSYYTLDELAEFDEAGLWSHNGVYFAAHGTLISTLNVLVEESEAGYFASELESLLHVSVKETLLTLVERNRLARETVSGLYLYCSCSRSKRKQQVLERKRRGEAPSLTGGVAIGSKASEELKAAIILFFSLLDEKQRRLYAGLESMKIGHGGDSKIAEFLDLNVGTVARGRQQLVSRDVEVDRVRKEGAGRKLVEKKRRK